MNGGPGGAHPELPETFGIQLPEVSVTPPGPLSLELARRLSRVESRNVTYLAPSFPVFWDAASGSNVRDVDGNIFLDLTAAFGVSVAGHGNSHVVEEIHAQADRLIHGMGDVHPPAPKVEFLEALSALAPWPDARVVLGSAGTEAVEAALKTALLATGRPGIVAFEESYHGLTLGSLAATERESFRGPFSDRLYPGVEFVPFPDPLRKGATAGSDSLNLLSTVLAEGVRGQKIGAVIIEPVQGRAGVRFPPEGFLREVARLTREAEAILIFDEIFTGLGRTGSLFACLHEQVLPDLLCLGKGLGGGLPLSACMGPAAVMDAWPPSEGEAIHTSTFLGHPLACTAGKAVLEEVEARGLVDRSRRLGTEFLERLRRDLGDIPEIPEIRGRGLFLGIEFAHPDSLEPMEGLGVRVAEEALRRGMLVLPGGRSGHVLCLSPPLVVTERQLDWAGSALAGAIRKVLVSSS